MRRRRFVHLVVALLAGVTIGAVLVGRYAAAFVFVVLMLAAALVLLVNIFSNVRSEGATQRANQALFRQRVHARFDEQEAKGVDERSDYLAGIQSLRAEFSEVSDELRKIHKILRRVEDRDASAMDERIVSGGEFEKSRKTIDSLREDLGSQIDSAAGEVLYASALSNQRLAAWHDGLMALMERVEFEVGSVSSHVGSIVERMEPPTLDDDVSTPLHVRRDPTFGVAGDGGGDRQSEDLMSPSSATTVKPGVGLALQLDSVTAEKLAQVHSAPVDESVVEIDGSETGLVSEGGDSGGTGRHGLDASSRLTYGGLLSALSSGLDEVGTRQLEVSSKLTTALYAETQQTEALLQLMPKISPRWMMPPLGRWALDAKAMLHLWQLVEDFRPRRVLELGSGTSTVWLGYLAERIGAKVVSVEHDAEYKERTEELVLKHGLGENVSVKHAPLQTLELEGLDYDWYAESAFEGVGDVDILLVDGPVGSSQRWARYPAVPALWERLSRQSLVVLDDSTRPDEIDCVNAWTQTFELKNIQHGMSRLAVMRRGLL